MNEASRARFEIEPAADSPGESSTVVHARNHSGNEAGRPGQRAAPLLSLPQIFFMNVPLVFPRVLDRRLNGNELLVRRTERLEITIATIKTRVCPEISPA